MATTLVTKEINEVKFNCYQIRNPAWQTRVEVKNKEGSK